MQDAAVWQFSLDALHAAAWGGSLLAALVVFARYLPLRTLVIATTVMTLGLVMLGAYVRLTDAGLGCPDWPRWSLSFSNGPLRRHASNSRRRTSMRR